EKLPFLIPLAVGLLDEDGRELPLRLTGEAAARRGTRVLALTEAEQRFVFEDVPPPPVPSLLRGFSAPVKLTGVPRERLRFLAAHDTDPFVRWDAGQQYATDTLLGLVAAWRRGDPLALDAGLERAMARTLEAAATDPAFAAEAIALPGESYLADQMQVVDVEGIHEARQFARAALGRALGAELAAAYAAFAESGEYRIDGVSIGRRALKNTCLAYLVAAGGENAVALAKAQFDHGGNMTDVLAALAVLAAVERPEREAALDAFYARWRHDRLVLDKWFAIQATSSAADTLARVKRLAEHPDFDLHQPNRMRALVASFAMGNPARFHDASGEGYRFLADAIIAVDGGNGQVAARMVPALGNWRRFDRRRRELMRGELERVLAAPGLSRNTFEMASKSLG
ncbi:MAG: DUF3458 domain-containing protein, partial [Alphaproteobacteria bacterium]|nr:DUF3458 domain-containing protein [Alphaproteobacteria bacterium]